MGAEAPGVLDVALVVPITSGDRGGEVDVEDVDGGPEELWVGGTAVNPETARGCRPGGRWIGMWWLEESMLRIVKSVWERDIAGVGKEGGVVEEVVWSRTRENESTMREERRGRGKYGVLRGGLPAPAVLVWIVGKPGRKPAQR